MCVPQQLLMSVMSARRDVQLSLVLQHHQLSSNQILAIHLLHEASKFPASFWQPYLQQLPRHFTTLMAWPQQAIQQLQLPHACEAAASAGDKARSEWQGARAALQELGLARKWCSWPAYCWAASCVLSRTMYHPDDPPCGCLTPLAAGAYKIVARRSYAPAIVAAAAGAQAGCCHSC
ncbi:hypothetical protein OEZ85_014047 [Tetradesmus obliquus]|uniref:Uncharacterized protein n=1 Tax=Tetradesmus obliquus TaxID=3088 RepID=A0ABY8UAQ7_TETOB|nr:hypothetical protein OEZ85_014047 [Tetradesmus obliquus]